MEDANTGKWHVDIEVESNAITSTKSIQSRTNITAEDEASFRSIEAKALDEFDEITANPALMQHASAMEETQHCPVAFDRRGKRPMAIEDIQDRPAASSHAAAHSYVAHRVTPMALPPVLAASPRRQHHAAAPRAPAATAATAAEYIRRDPSCVWFCSQRHSSRRCTRHAASKDGGPSMARVA